MAARIRKLRHDEETRGRIKASQLINRLTAHALGEVEMTSSAVTAGLGLLKKIVPDLSAVQHSGEDGGPLVVQIVNFADGQAPE